MKLEIYDKSRLDDQVKFIDTLSDSWKWKPWYPSKEELTEIYSRKGFTPDTRHYVYEGTELIAFLSSAVEGVIEGKPAGSIHIPFIKEGCKEAEELLMKKTLDTLKARGVKVVYAYIMPAWGDTEEIITRWGFIKKGLIAYRTLILVKYYADKKYSKPEKLQDLDIEKDKELVVDVLHQIRGLSKPEVRNIIDDLLKNNSVVATSLLKDRKDLSLGLLYKAPQPGKGFLRIYCLCKTKGKDLITDHLRFLIQKADEVGFSLLWHQVPDIHLIENYKEFNFTFEPFNEYILRLDKR
jgi:hypothetical protein